MGPLCCSRVKVKKANHPKFKQFKISVLLLCERLCDPAKVQGDTKGHTVNLPKPLATACKTVARSLHLRTDLSLI